MDMFEIIIGGGVVVLIGIVLHVCWTCLRYTSGVKIIRVKKTQIDIPNIEVVTRYVD